MELRISIKTKNDIECFILIVNIGIMAAIKEGLISIGEAENHLYNPYSVEKIKKLGMNENVVKLIELECELEDVESLLPEKLNDAINEISDKSIGLLRSIDELVLPLKKWID